MCCYMQLPIAFQDNQQISLADSTSQDLPALGNQYHVTGDIAS